MPVISRRGLLTAGGVLAAGGLIPNLAVAKAKPFTIGMVYIGHHRDWGWNQAQSMAADALTVADGVRVVDKPALSEDGEFNKAWSARYIRVIEGLIGEGASLVISTSFGDDPDVFALARKHPDVVFRNTATQPNAANPSNFGSQYCLIHQGQYVNGVAAGLSTGSNRLGFVAGLPEPSVLAGVNAFLTGARWVNPQVTVRVVFTRKWTTTPRDVEAVKALVEAGCDVITCHSDSPKTVLETAVSQGAKICGHLVDQQTLAPKGFVTGVEANWFPLFAKLVELREQGQPLPDFVTGGYDKDYIRSSPFGAGATPQAIKAAKSAIQAMKQNKPILVGPIKDNKGRIVVPAGKSLDAYAPEIMKTNYLVEGVIGSMH